MPINTGSIPKALWPGINEWWGNFYNDWVKEYPNILDVESSDQAYEDDVQITGFGLAPVKGEGAAVTYDDEIQGFTQRYTHLSYALGYIVTMEEEMDNLYAKVAKNRTRALARSMNQTKENVAANVYNRAFNSSYTGGDGVEMIATTHPSDAGNYSNHITTSSDISEAAIEDLLIQISQATDARGLKVKLQPLSLVVPTDLYFDANRIIKSALQNDTANNALNVIKSTNQFPRGIVQNHFLTDTDAWFIRTDCPDGLKLFQRMPIRFSHDNDFSTENHLYKAMERYAVGWTDPRGIYGSPGS